MASAQDNFEPSQVGIGWILDSHIREKLKPLGTEVTFATGNQVYRPGDVHPFLYLIEEGRFSFSRIGKSGRRATFAILGAGGTFGLYPLFLGIPLLYHCECIERGKMVRLDRDSMNALIDQDAEVRWAVIDALARRLKRVTVAFHDERMLPLRHRLALRLPEIADRDGKVTLTQSQLADLFGVSRFALGKALKPFRQEGLIEVGYGEVVVNNPQGLREYGMKNSDLTEV
ncbi:MAG: Crp/Fnr family transcriptional regulator [Pseudomonadota bacterium]